MKTNIEQTMQAALCFVAFVIIQFAVMQCAGLIVDNLAANATALVLSSLASSAITIALFVWRRWAVLSRDYFNTRQWSVFFWTVTTAIGMMPVASFVLETLNLRISNEQVQMYANMINHDLGYITIGIIAPVAEEIVFRGAILRSLLKIFDRRMHWIAIFISAVLFGIVHGNAAQGLNATITGLLLGWMYYRTRSVLPGIAFHWTNNTVVFVMTTLMPGTYNMTISELCGGDTHKIAIFMACALCVLIPSLYQLTLRIGMKKP